MLYKSTYNTPYHIIHKSTERYAVCTMSHNLKSVITSVNQASVNFMCIKMAANSKANEEVGAKTLTDFCSQGM